jgi:hypothetical protein
MQTIVIKHAQTWNEDSKKSENFYVITIGNKLNLWKPMYRIKWRICETILRHLWRKTWTLKFKSYRNPWRICHVILISVIRNLIAHKRDPDGRDVQTVLADRIG